MKHTISRAQPRSAKDLFLTKRPVSNVYLHLPFCQKKCHFCAFPVHAIGTARTPEVERLKNNYLQSLISQIENSRTYINIQPELRSLYIGGGTPSLFQADQISQICGLFAIQSAEVTLQMNPTELLKLEDFKKIPVNRFSVGIQTFENEKLAKMNRQWRYSREQMIQTLQSYRPANLSLDFILDFCVDELYFGQMIDFIERVAPEHVTLYMLEVNEGSFLQANLPKFNWLPRDSKVIERYLQASAKLSELGYNHYEISNFAKSKGHYSKHNQCYWAGNKQFLGYGMGAASLTNGLRITRPSTVSKYHKYVNCLKDNLELPFDELHIDVSEENTLQKQLQSIFMSGLRWEGGVTWNQLKQTSNQLYPTIRTRVETVLKEIQLQQRGLINWGQVQERIALTAPKGYLLADEIANRITTALQSFSNIPVGNISC